MSNLPPAKQEPEDDDGSMVAVTFMATLALGILLCMAFQPNYPGLRDTSWHNPWMIGSIAFFGLLQFVSFMGGTVGANLLVRFLALFALWTGMLIDAHYNALAPFHSTLFFVTFMANMLGAAVCAMAIHLILYFHADNKKAE